MTNKTYQTDKTYQTNKTYQTAKFVCSNIFNVDTEHFCVDMSPPG